jgi:hypothetical protein
MEITISDGYLAMKRITKVKKIQYLFNAKKQFLALGAALFLGALPLLAVAEVPIAVNDRITAVAGQTVNIAVKNLISNDTDGDGDNLSIEVVDDSENGLAIYHRETGIISFTPSSDTPTIGKFTYGLADVANSSDYAQMGFASVEIDFSVELDTVDLNADLTLPVASSDYFHVVDDSPIEIPFSALLSNDYDSNGDALYLSYIDDWLPGNIVFDKENGLIIFTPLPGFTKAKFTYGISDSARVNDFGRMAYAHVTLSKSSYQSTEHQSLGQGAGPIAENDKFYFQQGVTVVLQVSDLLVNDYDLEGDNIFLILVDDSVGGLASINAEQETVTFVLAPNTTQASFTYGISDSTTVNDFVRMGFGHVTLMLDTPEAAILF